MPRVQKQKIALPLRCLTIFCKTLKIPIISYEINLRLVKSVNCVICKADRPTNFAVSDTKILHSSSNSIISRQCKATTTVKTWG